MQITIESLVVATIVVVGLVVIVVELCDALDPTWRRLAVGETMRRTDEFTFTDQVDDDASWIRIGKHRIGSPAPDPAVLSHTHYRRQVSRWQKWARL